MLKGIAASAGVAIAKVYKLEQPKVEIVKVDNIDAANEIAKFNEALEATKKDIEGIKERADKIDFKELLDEKLGYPTPISYEDWIKANHYQKVRPADAKWLYRQELGYIESMKDITLKELAEQRIGEFTGALRKYILD